MTRECIIFTCFTLYILTISFDAVESNLLDQSDRIRFLSKCCPHGKIIGAKKSCVYNETKPFNVEVYSTNMKKKGKYIEEVFTILPDKFADKDLKAMWYDITLMEFNLYVIENGVLKLELPNTYDRWTSVEPDKFCFDYRITKAGIRKSFYGFLPEKRPIEKSSVYLTSASLVSCFFMLIVLVVYFLLPDLQNLCGMILMAYVASLFMAFLLLSIIQLTTHSVEACVGLTMGIYFCFLASFCWMSVMSYDIWWTFRGYAKARQIHRRGIMFKFLMYCLYAFGVPFAMTIALLILNTVNLRDIPWFITPNIPQKGCFLEDGIKLYYLYIPMLILIVCNWIFYLMTAFNIWRLSRGTAVLDSAAAGNKQAHRTHRHRFLVYLKLSVVMGLNWVLEIVSFQYPEFKVLWIITDSYNILIGVAIFLIFVCKKKILKKLVKRYSGSKMSQWHPSSKSYTSSTSDSNPETYTLQSKVSSDPNGLNGYALVSTKD